MNRRSIKPMIVLLLCAMVIFDPHIYGCGPFLPLAAFTFNDHPDLPLANYGRGRLGVLKPGYARSYLVVAYRHLSGVPLSRAEADEVAGLWKDRLGFSHDDGASEVAGRRSDADGFSDGGRSGERPHKAQRGRRFPRPPVPE